MRKMYKNKKGSLTDSVVSIALISVLILSLGSFFFINFKINQTNRDWESVIDTKKSFLSQFYSSVEVSAIADSINNKNSNLTIEITPIEQDDENKNELIENTSEYEEFQVKIMTGKNKDIKDKFIIGRGGKYE